jgi:putative FmdB family regulatory protein
MPTYEYECKSCKHSFEVFQSMSDQPLSDCPECGKEIRRLIFGGAGVIFKGSGFYVNDKGGAAKANSGETSPKPAACSQCPAAAETGKCPAAASQEPPKPKTESKSA